MTYKELLLYYVSDYQISKQLGLSLCAPKYWRRIGYIPLATQILIEKKTNGILKAAVGDMSSSRHYL